MCLRGLDGWCGPLAGLSIGPRRALGVTRVFLLPDSFCCAGTSLLLSILLGVLLLLGAYIHDQLGIELCKCHTNTV